MKKILIATTALVGTASVVAADTSFSGYGRWGIIYNEENGDFEETRLESRYRLNIDSSTETDGGVRFAARLRIQADDNSDGTVDAASANGARFQVGVGGFRVRVGNISGVTDAAVVIDSFGFEPGLIGQISNYSTWGANQAGIFDAYSSGGAGVNGVNVLYEAGPFAVMASYSEDFDERDGITTSGDFEAFEIGASYEIAGWTFGAVYGMADFGDANGDTDDDPDFYAVSATGSIGPADLSVFIGDSDVEDDDVAYGISGSFPVGANTDILGIYAGGGNDDLEDTFGIGFHHSLGGGVRLSGMVGEDTDGESIADLGVRFDF